MLIYEDLEITRVTREDDEYDEYCLDVMYPGHDYIPRNTVKEGDLFDFKKGDDIVTLAFKEQRAFGMTKGSPFEERFEAMKPYPRMYIFVEPTPT